MDKYNAVVRLYDPHAEAKATVNDLQRLGFAMNRLSIVGKDYHFDEGARGYCHLAAELMKTWEELGSVSGGLSRLLLGSGFYFIPGIGAVIVFGPLVGSIVRAMEAAVIADDLSALGAGLQSIGIPRHSIVEYETAVKLDKFIIIAHGAPDDLAAARDVVASPGAARIDPMFRQEMRPRA